MALILSRHTCENHVVFREIPAGPCRPEQGLSEKLPAPRLTRHQGPWNLSQAAFFLPSAVFGPAISTLTASDLGFHRSLILEKAVPPPMDDSLGGARGKVHVQEVAMDASGHCPRRPGVSRWRPSGAVGWLLCRGFPHPSGFGHPRLCWPCPSGFFRYGRGKVFPHSTPRSG